MPSLTSLEKIWKICHSGTSLMRGIFPSKTHVSIMHTHIHIAKYS